MMFSRNSLKILRKSNLVALVASLGANESHFNFCFCLHRKLKAETFKLCDFVTFSS